MRAPPAHAPGRASPPASPAPAGDAYCPVMASINVRLAVFGRSESRRCSTPASRDAVSRTEAAPLPILSTSASTVSACASVCSSAAQAASTESAQRATARLAMVASRHARTSSRTATRKPATHAENTASASAPSAGRRSCAARAHAGPEGPVAAATATSPRLETRARALEEAACDRFEPTRSPSSRAGRGGRRAAASRAPPSTADADAGRKRARRATRLCANARAPPRFDIARARRPSGPARGARPPPRAGGGACATAENRANVAILHRGAREVDG